MIRTFLALLFITITAASQAQQHVVIELRATGSTRFAEEDILRASGIERGKRPIPLSEVKDAATKLVATGAFKEVGYKHSAVLGGMKVEFMVTDADEFVRADFDNIVWLSLAELNSELQKRVPLFKGELPVGGGGLAEDVAMALQGLLNERGVKARVANTLVGARDGEIGGYLYAAEDVAIKIGRMDFSGASAPFLPQLESAARPMVGSLFHRAKLLDAVEHSLRTVYLRRGHLHARFGEPHISVVSQQGTETVIAVTLPIEEGRAYRFAGVRWRGNTVVPLEDIRPHVHVQPGQPMDAVQWEADLLAVRGLYGKRGYVKTQINVQPYYDETAATVRYNAEIVEGEMYRMAKLEVAGLQPSSAERVHQRWRMREGDPFNTGYVSDFFSEFRLPRGFAYKVELSDGEAANTFDVTLIFCDENTKCLPSATHQLALESEPRRRK